MFRDNSSESPRMEDVGIACYLVAKRTVRANKNHVCQCGKPIKRGENYIREVWRVEKEVIVEKHGIHIHKFEE